MHNHDVEHAKSKNSPRGKRKQIVLPKIFVNAVAELVGTAMLICFGCMGCIATDSMELPHHVPAFSFGIVVMIVLMTFGHISGAHVNPVVTLCSVILGMLTPAAGIVYAISQLTGSVLGFGLLKFLVPVEYTKNEKFDPLTNETVHEIGLCSTVVNPKITTMQALGIEVITTISLILLCCSVWDKRNARNTDSVALRFGLTIAAVAMFAGPFSGASMNPARSIGPAVFNKDWDKHWIYWVGPSIGSIVASIFYKTVFSEPPEDLDTTEHDVEDVPLNEKPNRT